MVTVLMGIVVIAVAAVVILFLPSKKPSKESPKATRVEPTPEPVAPKQDDKKEEVKDDIIAKLDKEIDQLKEEIEKEKLKSSTLQGELNAAKKAELDLAQEVKELKEKSPTVPSESEAVAIELLKKENEELKGKLSSQAEEIDRLNKKQKADETIPEPAIEEKTPAEQKPEFQPEPPKEEPQESAPPEKSPEGSEPGVQPDPPKEEKPNSDPTEQGK